VQRYPEVLEYFFGLVRLDLPSEEDASVKDPPLSALAAAVPGVGVGNGGRERKVRVRESSEVEERRRRRASAGRRTPVAAPPPRRERPGAPFAPVQGYYPPGY